MFADIWTEDKVITKEGRKMLVKEVLQRRDKLKNYSYGLKRSINYFSNVLNDKELASDLEDLHTEIEEEFNKINSALSTFEDLEM